MQTEDIQRAMYGTALWHYHEGRLTEAAACCSTILNQTPREFRTLRLLGQVRRKQGALDEAAYFLTAALGIGSTDTADVIVALNELAAVEAAREHYDAAFDYYYCALAIEPNDARTLYNYGNALYAADQLDAAIAIYREGLSRQPDVAEIHNNLGNALRGTGKLEEAVDSYRRAIGLGDALYSHNRYDEAREQFQQTLRRHPGDVTALFKLGITLLASYRNEEAAVWLERAVAISPSYGEARMALGNALVGLNRHSEALLQYRESGATMPDSAELKFNGAIALLGIGAWPEGWQVLEARFAIASVFPEPPVRNNAPYWRGETGIDDKTILLQTEQGLGDTLQYVHYAPLVAERGAQVILRAGPAQAAGGNGRG